MISFNKIIFFIIYISHVHKCIFFRNFFHVFLRIRVVCIYASDVQKENKKNIKENEN